MYPVWKGGYSLYDGGWLAHEGTDADAAWFWEPLKLNQM